MSHRYVRVVSCGRSRPRTLPFSHVVAHTIWWRRGVFPLRCRVHRLQRREPLPFSCPSTSSSPFSKRLSIERPSLPAPVHARMCSRASLPGSIARAGATGPPSSGLPVHSCRAHSPALAQLLLPHLDTEPSRDVHAAQVPGKKIECTWPRGRGRGVPMALGVGEIHEGVPRVGVCIEHVLL